MLTHLAVDVGTPPRDSASRTIPTTRIKTRTTLENATYSDRGLPKIIMRFSCPMCSGSQDDGICTIGFRSIHPTTQLLAAGHGADDQKWLGSRCDRVGQRGVRRLMGEILLAREEPHERAAHLSDVVADRPSQHRIAGLERVKDRTLRD